MPVRPGISTGLSSSLCPSASSGSWGVGWSCGVADVGLPLTRLTSYTICVVGEEQIQQYADESEAGYDVEELKRRGRGRPGRGAKPMQVVAVRLTTEEVAALDEMAGREHLSRSEVIRRALANFTA
jgi:hypothetical protein